MITIKRTTSENTDFINLVAQLDEGLKIKEGNGHPFYAQYNKIDKIKYAVAAYENKMPVGCVAIKEYEENIMEVKRMFVPRSKREKELQQKFWLNLRSGRKN